MVWLDELRLARASARIAAHVTVVGTDGREELLPVDLFQVAPLRLQHGGDDVLQVAFQVVQGDRVSVQYRVNGSGRSGRIPGHALSARVRITRQSADRQRRGRVRYVVE